MYFSINFKEQFVLFKLGSYTSYFLKLNLILILWLNNETLSQHFEKIVQIHGP